MKSAFPNRHKGTEVSDSHIEYFDEGMTLRDYFAAKAMQAMLTDAYTDGRCAPNCSAPKHMIADWAYAMADYMMDRRKISREATNDKEGEG